MYTYKVEQAIQAAAILHTDHARKGAVPIPYITHLFSVMMMVRDYTSDEDTLVAALLHDTLEDTDYTKAELTADFGDAVAEVVVALTEPTATDTPNWLARKQTYANQIKRAPLAAAIIAAADKAHNFRSMIDEYHDDHKRFGQDFGKNITDRLDGYTAIANAINSRLKDGIVHEFNQVFNLYKEFLLHVQEKQGR